MKDVCVCEVREVVPINRQGLNTSKGQKYVTVLYLTEAGYAQKYKNDNPQVENM